MDSNAVMREQPSYADILIKKSGRIRIAEAVFFITFLIVLVRNNYLTFDGNIAIFIVFPIAYYISFPFLYRLLVNPCYSMTKRELIIEKWGQKEVIPFHQIQSSYDFKQYYWINGKKRAIMASDDFLAYLSKQVKKRERNLLDY